MPPPGGPGTPPSPARPPEPEASLPRRWWGLAALALAQTTVLADAAFAHAAVMWRGAGRDLGLPLDGLKATSTVYLDLMPVAHVLAFACLPPFGARIGGPALGLLAGRLLPLDSDWRWCLFAAVPFVLVAALGAAVLVHDRPGRTGARPDGLGVLGIAGIAGAVPYFTGHVALIPVAGALLAAFVRRRTRTPDALAPPSGAGARAHVGSFFAAALADVAVAALLIALGHLS
ncbi:hypothetical protein [Streptomyces sp. NPDC058861]|uniref:hypothetical protein n=1 Tax=Streptomyces sp. NPDC058861 TaxID=3346653 RepID=UPI0036ACA63C